MTKFFATCRHHSISRMRTIEIEGTLTQAKQVATRNFGDEQRDYEIVIYTGDDIRDFECRRKVGSKQWREW